MSHEATLWAVRACDVPLEERMVLVYLADCNCPDNGCLVTPQRFTKEAGIDLGELRGTCAFVNRHCLIVRLLA